MENLPKHLKDQYNFERELLPEDEGVPSNLINYSDILQGYYFLVDYFENLDLKEKMLVGLGNANLLASAVSRQTVSFGGYTKWPDPIDVSASLFFGLVKNHAFLDGNKRIALLMLLKSLWRGKRVVDAPQPLFEKLTVAVAGSTLGQDFPNDFKEFIGSEDPEVRFISKFLRRNTRTLSREIRSITYREAKTVINRYGFDLADPHDNYIGVYQTKRKTGWLGLGKTQEILVRLGNIGFPSWTKQLSRNTLEHLREMTNLTAENGYDSEVFFRNSEPVYRLIHDFEHPLKRLKDR